MGYKSAREVFKKIGYYIPVTAHFVVFTLVSWAAFIWLQKQKSSPDTPYNDIFSLLIKVAIWFIIVALGFAFISVILPYIWFQWQKRKGKLSFRIQSPDKTSFAGGQLIALKVHPILRPFLGFIKFRLYYDNEHTSNKFSIVADKKRQLFTTTLRGVYHWQLPQIKEYNISYAIVYFEDYLQFFSLVGTVHCDERFHVSPSEYKMDEMQTSPRKTEDTQTRIEELKKVEGEYLQYKNFETNDDVRRIVWKIYAKTKDLVVRTPEILDPYASHIYLYPSFHSSFNVLGNDVVEIPFLNYYKIIVWNVYKQLGKNGMEIRCTFDQPLPPPDTFDQDLAVQHHISVTKWQQENGLETYIKANEAAVVILSSLNDKAEIEKLIEQYGGDMMFVFVRLSKGLRGQHIGDWLKWLFIKPQKDQYKVYKSSWRISSLRSKIKRNEKEIKKMLDGRERSIVI